MLPRVDTKNAAALSAFVQETFSELYVGHPHAWAQRLFREIEALFKGDYPGYAPGDLRYHDFEHTLQGTLCMARLLRGRFQAGAEHPYQRRHLADLS